MIPPYFRLLRPSQWIKNTFIFAPLVFSKHLFQTDYFLTTLEGFVAFCLLSSAVYIINDISDREADRIHPHKRFRPLASGDVTVSSAMVVAALLIAAVILLAIPLSGAFQMVLLSYLLIQILYSIRLKHIAVLDVFIIAAGFMLRVVGGALVLRVTVSQWIVVCTMFLSLFLATAKRRGEIVLITNAHLESERKSLKEYSLPLLDHMMMITAAGMAISYALYTVAERTVTVFGTENLILTTIFVLFGIFRYLYLVMQKNMGENAVAVILKDVPMFVNLCLWFASCVFIIYS